jgi:hypothetical protein
MLQMQNNTTACELFNYSISILPIMCFAKTTLVYQKITLGMMDLYLQMAAVAAFCHPCSLAGAWMQLGCRTHR